MSGPSIRRVRHYSSLTGCKIHGPCFLMTSKWGTKYAGRMKMPCLRPFVWLAFLQTPHFSTGNLQPAE